MKRSDLRWAALWLAAVVCLHAEPTLSPPAPSTDPIGEALPILQSKYAGFADLHYQAGDSLGALASRSQGKITLLSPDSASTQPMQMAVLPEQVLYLRAPSFRPKQDWPHFLADVRSTFSDRDLAGAVFDLRSNGSTDYVGAAQLLALLAPADAAFEKFLPASSTDGGPTAPRLPLFSAPVVVLTNSQTAAAGEALASRLKSDGALVVGRPTAGVSFEEDKLSDGAILRFAVAPVAVTGASVVRPVTPDLTPRVDEHNEKAALMLIRDDHVLDVIEESAERPRMSEASLVQGQDPEWDAYLASLEKGPVLLSLPRIHDPVLITALDSLRAIHVAQNRPPVDATAANAPAVRTPVE